MAQIPPNEVKGRPGFPMWATKESCRRCGAGDRMGKPHLPYPSLEFDCDLKKAEFQDEKFRAERR
jgi:hypothetical protein